MKRLFSFLLVLVLVFSLTATAFAVEPTGSITITNATPDKEYNVYKLFDANYNASTEAVTYTIAEGDQFYDDLFDGDGKPTPGNKYFEKNDVQNIIKADGVSDDELFAYITGLIAGKTPAAGPKTLGDGETTITFKDLPYGYYIITSELGAAVTITSNTPKVEVIDKNQNPDGQSNFKKEVWNSATGASGAWDKDHNTSAVGELVKYRVTFNGQNYDGQQKIQYYTIYDEKGSALWVEFGTKDPAYLANNIKITIGDEVLKRGYYLPIGEIDTNEWEFLGDWTGVAEDRDNAQWYLVHESYDKFRFMIPWMEGHAVTGDNTPTYGLDFKEDAEFLYDSNTLVTIEYCASVEYNAEVGGGAERNLFNKAQLTWTCAKTSGSTDWQEVYTDVFGIALKKIDSTSLTALQGAEFAVYTDEDCTKPFYVIPTDIEGVYIKDDFKCDGQQITGTNKATARKKYEAKLNEYLGGDTQKNVVTTPVNGKIVILGMDAGSYYLKETKAPDGYNPLNTTFEIKAGIGMKDFHVFAIDSGEDSGKVEDIQAEAGNYKDNNYHVTSSDVKNSQGLELPSTGGSGTMIMITIGTVVALAFAVLLITHKKMSVYHD